MRTLFLILSFIVLVACANPPKPPTVDGTDKQAVNTIAAAKGTPQSKALIANQSITPLTVRNAEPAGPSSRTVSVHFPFNGTRFQPTAEQEEELLSLLAIAKRVNVRGRTDGQRPNVADNQIALKRALSAQRYLVGKGLSATIISVNYLSAGDYVADNYSDMGRARNRRVDIEVYLEKGKDS